MWRENQHRTRMSSAVAEEAFVDQMLEILACVVHFEYNARRYLET